ncbi:hypothetical protein [Streptomyces sp. NPDC047315]|uniref:hypothetical protein n=1 Tax=Streptomyces sp. NPDC047315 TaxID=3155142 RepID=UPI00340A11EA
MSRPRRAPGRYDGSYRQALRMERSAWGEWGERFDGLSAPRPEPAAAWTAVCFHPARPGAAASRGRDADRPLLLVWRSDVTRGPVLVRSTAVPSPDGPEGRGPDPCPYPRDGRPPCDVHLRADPGGSELAHHADVLVGRVPLPPAEARRRARELLVAHPGCLVVAVPVITAGCVVGVRDGAGGAWCVRSQPDDPGVAIPTPVFASVVHAWVVAGGSPRELRSVSLVRR